jgi:transposase-like protein
MANNGVASDKSEIVAQLPVACSDERAAVEFMEAMRWPNGEVACPHCGVVGESRQMQSRKGGRNERFLWRCQACKHQFTVRVGTVFEDSRIPLRHWCYAFWAACASKKGVSALQIKRQTGLSYKSALFMMHRIRFAMADAPETLPPLTGTVEVDETYVGGKPRYPHTSKRGRGSDKEQVLGMVERGGELRPVHVHRGMSVPRLVEAYVTKDSTLVTDEAPMYRKLGRSYADHLSVMHSVREYARGTAHTNTIEGFFSLLKRGLYGTFHSVSVKHLHRYLSEFQFRYNARKLDDGDRTALAIRKADGRRLIYRESTRRRSPLRA